MQGLMTQISMERAFPVLKGFVSVRLLLGVGFAVKEVCDMFWFPPPHLQGTTVPRRKPLQRPQGCSCLSVAQGP